jgi:6-phosphofructokinase 2
VSDKPLDILTVTLNPTIDLTTSVAAVVAGPKLRCAVPQVDPGGGGINVARAVRLLGGMARALVAVGGVAGDEIVHLLAEQGVATVALRAPGDTRESFAVTDRASGQQYRFVLPGPLWQPADVKGAMEAILGAAHEGGLVVLSGSQPPGVPADFPLRLAARLKGHARLLVDTSGDSLRTVAAGGSVAPWCLRMDDMEAAELAGRPLVEARDSAAFAAELVARGVAEVVIIARGADGGVLAARGKRLHGRSAKVEVVSKVGAGDSFVGAFVLSIAQGEALEAALRHGNAAASAAVMTEATRLCRLADVTRLLQECAVAAL